MDYLSHPEEVKIKIIVKIGKKLEKNLEEKINKKKEMAGTVEWNYLLNYIDSF